MNNLSIFENAIAKRTERRGRKKKLHVVIDCESVDIRINMVDMWKTAVNWGITIGDSKGNVLFERDFIIEDIYNLPLKNIINSFYIAKLQKIENDDTTVMLSNFAEYYNGLKLIWTNHSAFYDLEFWSYNANFDYDCFIKNASYFMNENFRDYEFEEWLNKNWHCIQNLACNTILNDDFKLFVLENMLMTDKGNYSTTAEDTYRFITNNPEFEEDHTGMSDSQIEYEILLECLKVVDDKEVGLEQKERTSMAWRMLNPNSYQRGKNQYCVASKGHIFWEKAHNCLPVGAEDTKFIRTIEL